MKKYISRFHYLTQDLPAYSQVAQTQAACDNGANWIQYRCLSKSDPELLEEIHQIASICDDWGATLIITDHYHLIDQADIQGVHIEDMNADFAAIRASIGPEKTLGASANTVEDILRIRDSMSVDYIGCGPFAVTHTKPNDYPLLGTKGYNKIADHMKNAGIDIPLIAVGGIAIADIERILTSGVYGIALSAAVNLAVNPGKAFREIYKKLY